MTVVPLVRHPGKRTSGRFVYSGRDGSWTWQCDMHPEYEPLPDQYGEGYLTMQSAFEDALAHAKVCPFTTVPHEHRPGYRCPACGVLADRQAWGPETPESRAHRDFVRQLPQDSVSISPESGQAS